MHPTGARSEPFELEPWPAPGDEVPRGDMRDVPNDDIGVLDGVVVVVDRWNAAGGSGRTRLDAAPACPGFCVGELQRPQLAVVMLPRTNHRASIRGLVDH